MKVTYAMILTAILAAATSTVSAGPAPQIANDQLGTPPRAGGCGDGSESTCYAVAAGEAGNPLIGTIPIKIEPPFTTKPAEPTNTWFGPMPITVDPPLKTSADFSILPITTTKQNVRWGANPSMTVRPTGDKVTTATDKYGIPAGSDDVPTGPASFLRRRNVPGPTRFATVAKPEITGLQASASAGVVEGAPEPVERMETRPGAADVEASEVGHGRRLERRAGRGDKTKGQGFKGFIKNVFGACSPH